MGGGPQPAKMDTLTFYKELAEVPAYSSATFLGQNALNLHLSTRSHLLKTRLKSSKTIVLSSPEVVLPATELPAKTSEFWSTNGKLKGVLKTIGDNRYVEVWDWSAGRRIADKEITEEVGDLLDDETWGTPTFSPFSSVLVFTAHRLPDKDASSIKKREFTPIWGETYRTLISPTPFLFDFTTPSEPVVRTIISRELDPTISFGPAQFAFVNGKERLVLAGFETLEDGRRYGVVYCTNRRSGIWLADLPTKDSKSEDGAILKYLVRLTDPERSVRSPRVMSRKGENDILVYLSNPFGAAHNSCASLHARALLGADAWTSKTQDVVVDSIASPSPTSFPGLYLNSLPTQPFVYLPHQGAFVLLTSCFHSRSTIYAIPLEFGKAKPIGLTTEAESGKQPCWTVLGTDGKSRLIAVREGLVELKTVLVGEFVIDAKRRRVEWGNVVETSRVSDEAASLLASLKPSILDTPSLSFPVQTLLLSPASNSSSPPPLILIPHGGPHGTTMTTFSPPTIALAAAGFACAMVNYHGSLGFGEDAVQSLVGECGVLDVRDCVGVVEEWKRKWKGKGEGEGKIFIQGGSHGGFLTAHLTSLYPDLFTAAILRNPVTSFGENCTITDIPDWNFGELALPFPFSPSVQRPLLTPTPEQYELMQSRSPITNVLAVKAATLILMGEEDRRVPPSQTKAWYHSLKGKSSWIRHQNSLLPEDSTERQPELDVECLSFPGEGHALDGVEAEVVGFEAGLEWFRSRARFD